MRVVTAVCGLGFWAHDGVGGSLDRWRRTDWWWSWVLLLLCPASVVTGQLGLAAANESGGDVIGDAGKHGGELVIEMVKGRGDEVRLV
ncbi:hypothetical protein M0R45_026887 [Rubus argutus]|uniref:Uncharacterized protein n=1 Tax=Rubus argutus TaxID=59490 RepID=A0AAW1WYX4_RUBAR